MPGPAPDQVVRVALAVDGNLGGTVEELGSGVVDSEQHDRRQHKGGEALLAAERLGLVDAGVLPAREQP